MSLQKKGLSGFQTFGCRSLVGVWRILFLDFVEECGFVFGFLYLLRCPAEDGVVFVCFAMFSDFVASDGTDGTVLFSL